MSYSILPIGFIEWDRLTSILLPISALHQCKAYYPDHPKIEIKKSLITPLLYKIVYYSINPGCYPLGGVLPTSMIDRLLQIFRTSRFAISVWRGTASKAPVFGFIQRECSLSSRLRMQPCNRRCRSKLPRFKSSL